MLQPEIYDHCACEAAEWGDNEDRSGCYLSFRAPLETWPMAPSILVPLTLACDIIAHCPDIDPNAVHCGKKATAEGQPLRGGREG